MILEISIVKICLSLVVSIDNNQNFKNVGEMRQPIALFANRSILHKKGNFYSGIRLFSSKFSLKNWWKLNSYFQYSKKLGTVLRLNKITQVRKLCSYLARNMGFF